MIIALKRPRKVLEEGEIKTYPLDITYHVYEYDPNKPFGVGNMDFKEYCSNKEELDKKYLGIEVADVHFS